MSLPLLQPLPLSRRPQPFSHPHWLFEVKYDCFGRSRTWYVLYVDHLADDGERLFQAICERDLEGIVAKHRHSRYTVEDGNPASVKIRNRSYSQIIGRDELFERKYEAEGAPEIGWHVCDRMAAQVA